MEATPDLSNLTAEDVVTVYRLIEQLCEIGGNAEQWRRHLSGELQRILSAQMISSYLMNFSLNPQDIGPKTLVFVEVGTNQFWMDYRTRGDLTGDPVTPFIMERFGTDFTCTRQEWFSDELWYGSKYYAEVATPSGWDHCIYSQVGIIRPGVVDGLGIARKLGEPPYTPRDVAIVRFIHQELARLWRKHDPMDAHSLPARQREVMEGIRRGESRKAIAEKMGVTDHTVHSYEKALFERARVTSRQELQALLSKMVRPVLMP